MDSLDRLHQFTCSLRIVSKMLNECVGTRAEPRFVSIVGPSNAVWRTAGLASNLEDLGVPRWLPDPMTTYHDSVSDVCFQSDTSCGHQRRAHSREGRQGRSSMAIRIPDGDRRAGRIPDKWGTSALIAFVAHLRRPARSPKLAARGSSVEHTGTRPNAISRSGLGRLRRGWRLLA